MSKYFRLYSTPNWIMLACALIGLVENAIVILTLGLVYPGFTMAFLVWVE